MKSSQIFNCLHPEGTTALISELKRNKKQWLDKGVELEKNIFSKIMIGSFTSAPTGRDEQTLIAALKNLFLVSKGN